MLLHFVNELRSNSSSYKSYIRFSVTKSYRSLMSYELSSDPTSVVRGRKKILAGYYCKENSWVYFSPTPTLNPVAVHHNYRSKHWQCAHNVTL
jgi:hypothetical protein